MPLIQCPDCKQQISDQAPSCPHCGRPNAIQSPPGRAAIAAVQTIEQTGKRYKSMEATGVLCIIAGLIGLSVGGIVWGFLFLVGIPIYFAGRMGAWWHHG